MVQNAQMNKRRQNYNNIDVIPEVVSVRNKNHEVSENNLFKA